MTDEVLTLIAITPSNFMEGSCLTSDVILLTRDCFQVTKIQLSCYSSHMSNYLPKSKISTMQEINSSLDNPEFFSKVRELANGFETSSNLALIKTGCFLLSKKLVTTEILRKTFKTYVLFDTQTSRNGLPAKAKKILRALVNMNRFFPLNLIQTWLDYNLSMMKFTEKMLPHEFLFLVANSQDRLKLISQNFQTNFDLSKDHIGVFSLDNTLETHPNQDFRLENAFPKFSKIVFDFDKKLLFPPTPPPKVALRKHRQFTENETVRKFKELLKDPQLIFQVKSAISNSRSLIHKSQNNNAKFSYIQYRKKKGVMGSLESSRVNLSKTVTRDYSYISKDETLKELFGLKQEIAKFSSRPVSASTTNTRPTRSRPQTGKRPLTGGSLASTVPISHDLLNVKSLRL